LYGTIKKTFFFSDVSSNVNKTKYTSKSFLTKSTEKERKKRACHGENDACCENALSYVVIQLVTADTNRLRTGTGPLVYVTNIVCHVPPLCHLPPVGVYAL
jgi:hypothetical protein